MAFGLDYVTEVQANFEGEANWANLLVLDGRYTPWRNGEFALQTISFYKIPERSIAETLQCYSNIDADNMALNIFMMGYTHHFKDVSLFAGVRSANEDYFIQDYTALFANSSCGIYPTIADNMPAANYPVSAMGLHAEFRLSESWTIKNSLYNGVAGKLYGDEPSIFNIRPAHDGIFDIGEISYTKASGKYGFYSLGAAYHSPYDDYSGGEKVRTASNYAVWGSVEQSVAQWGNREFGILLQGSFAPRERNECRNYYGGGVLFKGLMCPKKQDMFGVLVNRADFREAVETSVEVSWQCEILPHVSLQPAFHYFITGDEKSTIGLLRLNFSL